MAGDRIASHRRRMALNAVLSIGRRCAGWMTASTGGAKSAGLGVWDNGQLTVTLDKLDKSRERGRTNRGVPGCCDPCSSVDSAGVQGVGDWIPSNLTSTPVPNPDPHHNAAEDSTITSGEAMAENTREEERFAKAQSDFPYVDHRPGYRKASNINSHFEFIPLCPPRIQSSVSKMAIIRFPPFLLESLTFSPDHPTSSSAH